MLSSTEVGAFGIIAVSSERNLWKSKGFSSSSEQSDICSPLTLSFSADSDNKSLGALPKIISISLCNALFFCRYDKA